MGKARKSKFPKYNKWKFWKIKKNNFKILIYYIILWFWLFFLLKTESVFLFFQQFNMRLIFYSWFNYVKRYYVWKCITNNLNQNMIRCVTSVLQSVIWCEWWHKQILFSCSIYVSPMGKMCNCCINSLKKCASGNEVYQKNTEMV